MIPLHDLWIGGRFLRQLPSFLRNPVTVAEARATLARRLMRRRLDFLALAKTAIYGNRRNPYRALLRQAGCEYGDLTRLVEREGVEGALGTLVRHGVYLTVDEFKGRRPVRRGSATVEIAPDDLRNPGSGAHFSSQTSGSRGARSVVPIDLAWIRDWAIDECLYLDAAGGLGWTQGRWAVPGGASLAYILMWASVGTPPVRWFSQVDPRSTALHPRYRWSSTVLTWGSRLAGRPLPLPVYVPFEDPSPIVRWLADELRSGATPCLVAYTSSVARLCQAAAAAGVDLAGARAVVAGEPLTTARLATIRRAGVEAILHYASMDSGPIGKGCPASAMPDELHVFHDLVATIHPPPETTLPGLPARTLLVSSLRDTTALILLNVSLGDQGVLTDRRCGCPLDRLGWTTHLHTVRSFEKLTAGGMTFFDADLIRAIEDVLPARFGGTAADYQLVEEEAGSGLPSLRLLVHPRVGLIDAEAVVEVFLGAIGPGSGIERVMGLMWRDARLVRVERRAPLATPSGKILHLHVER